MPHAIKFIGDDTLEICAIPFGGHIKGRDTDGEFFSPRTDLCLDWFPDTRPLLYDHGMDAYTANSAVGRVDSKTAEKRDDGWWVRAQLDRKSRYVDQMRQLIEQDGLFASSGAMPHLVQKSRGGEIMVWPWVELSLTPTPANMLARVSAADVAKHYKSAGLIDDLTASIAALGDAAALPATVEAWIRQTDTAAAKVGRVLSADNEKKIRTSIAALQQVLDALGG